LSSFRFPAGSAVATALPTDQFIIGTLAYTSLRSGDLQRVNRRSNVLEALSPRKEPQAAAPLRSLISPPAAS
jgi:hypothetical protein